MKCIVLVDFDGTIATEDTTDLLLERYADPQWYDVEDDWKAGRIGSRECLVRQIDLVRATPEQYDTLVGQIEIDPEFPAFVDFCRRNDMDMLVVSDGLDRTVGTVLERYGLDLPFRANKLQWIGGDRWRLSFPHARSDCLALSGNCKCQFAVAPGAVRIAVGDGRSDFCVSERVDLALAKGALADHCARKELPHYPFARFGEARACLERWLDARARRLDTTLDQLRDE